MQPGNSQFSDMTRGDTAGGGAEGGGAAPGNSGTALPPCTQKCTSPASYATKGELTTLNLLTLMKTAELRSDKELEGRIAHADDCHREFHEMVGRYIMQVSGSVIVPAAFNACVQGNIKREVSSHKPIVINTSASLRVAECAAASVGVAAIARLQRRGRHGGTKSAASAPVGSGGSGVIATTANDKTHVVDYWRNYLLRGEVDGIGEIKSEFLRNMSYQRFRREMYLDLKANCRGRARPVAPSPPSPFLFPC